MSDLKSILPEIDKCVKCGTCRSVCPTTRVLGRESACARGKLTLIKSYINGELAMSENYMRHIKECAMCGGCRDVCPAGVKTTDVYLAARADMVEEKGLSFLTRLVFNNLGSTRLMPSALRLGARLKGILFKKGEAVKEGSAIETDTGLISRFSLPLVGDGRLMPTVAGKFFLDFKEVRKLGKRPKKSKSKKEPADTPKVAFFAGCGVNYLMPNVGTASLKCIERTGALVSVPKGQVCCGMPAFYTGDVETARRLAKKNIEVFEEYDFDYVATSCATCSHGLKTVFKKLFEDDDKMRSRAEAFTAKVRDITELLARDLGPMKSIESSTEEQGKEGGNDIAVKPISVTYHDPCHLNRNQGIKAEPRALLQNAKGVDFKNMKFACSCCGLGGGLSMTNYDLSIAITKRKADGALASGADVIATACPGCIVQLRDAMNRYGVEKKVVHLVELL